MQFLSADQCRALTKKLGVDYRGPVAGSRAAKPLKVFDVIYESRTANGPAVANVVVEHLSPCSTRLVWTT